MTNPRDLLNELKWRHHALDDALIHYRHRGAPGDAKDLTGGDIITLGRSFIHTRGRHGTVSIPYHRVLAIERDGHTVWRRSSPDPQDAHARR